MTFFFVLIAPFAKRFKLFLINHEHSKLTKKFKSFGKNSKLGYPSLILNPQYISVGNNFSSLWNLRLEAWDEYDGDRFNPSIVIGDNVNINSDVHIGCIESIVIGNNVLMASRIYISDHSHGQIDNNIRKIPPAQRKLFSKGPVIIEDNVWIGEGVCILPGVKIGKNSIIGANAVVTVSVPPNAVVAGVPAKVIRILE